MKKKDIIIIICIAMIIPLLIAIGITIPIMEKINNSSPWIGFWGSYIGSIFGGMVTLYVLNRTIDANRENVENTLLLEKQKESNHNREFFCESICESALTLSTDMYELATMIVLGKNVDNNIVKKVTISYSMLYYKLKCELENVEYKHIDQMIAAINEMKTEFDNILIAKSYNDKESIAWDAIMLNFTNKYNELNKAIEQFYIENKKLIPPL